MDALQILRDDHRRVKELFRQFSEAGDGSTRKAIVDEAIAELMVHSQLEEEIFYPAMERAGFRDLIAHAEEEHHAAETIMNELLAVDARDATLEPRFTALADTVREHIDAEESQIFPRAAELGMDRLDKLGDELQERRTQIMRGPAARTPQHPVTATRSRSAGTRKRKTARTAARKTATTVRKTVSKAATSARKTATTARKTTAKAARKTATTARKTASKAATGASKTATTARKTATKVTTGARKMVTAASKTAKATARRTTASANGSKATRATTTTKRKSTAGSRK